MQSLHGGTPPNYQVVSLGDYTYPAAVNDSLDVVGYHQFPGSDSGAFYFANGTYYNLYVPGSNASQAFAINDKGRSVGQVGFPSTDDAVRFVPGSKPVYLGKPPGMTYAEATAINANGEIVGDSGSAFSCLSSRLTIFTGSQGPRTINTAGAAIATAINNKGVIAYTHAVISANGRCEHEAAKYPGGMVPLPKNAYSPFLVGYPGPGFISPELDINDNGDMVGCYTTREQNGSQGPVEGFYYHDRVTQEISAPSGLCAVAVNDKGWIVGDYEGGGAFVRINGTITPLTQLGGATAIDSNGDIVGWGAGQDGNPTGYLLEYTP